MELHLISGIIGTHLVAFTSWVFFRPYLVIFGTHEITQDSCLLIILSCLIASVLWWYPLGLIWFSMRSFFLSVLIFPHLLCLPLKSMFFSFLCREQFTFLFLCFVRFLFPICGLWSKARLPTGILTNVGVRQWGEAGQEEGRGPTGVRQSFCG